MRKYCGNTTNLAAHLKSQHLQEYLKAGFSSAVTCEKVTMHTCYYSTPSEQLFSKVGNIINTKHTVLDSENASMLCFFAENL